MPPRVVNGYLTNVDMKKMPLLLNIAIPLFALYFVSIPFSLTAQETNVGSGDWVLRVTLSSSACLTSEFSVSGGATYRINSDETLNIYNNGIINGFGDSWERESFSCPPCRSIRTDDDPVCESDPSDPRCFEIVCSTCSRYVCRSTTPLLTFNSAVNSCQSFSSGVFSFRFHPKVPGRPTVSPQCAGTESSILLTAPDVESFQWEVSKNIFSGWTLIPGKSGNLVTITYSELVASGFSPSDLSGNLFARVKDPSCNVRTSPPSFSFLLYKPSPQFTPQPFSPSCNSGVNSDNGKIEITISNGSVSGYKVTLLYGGSLQYQDNFLASEFPLLIDKQRLLNNGITFLSGIIPGNWQVNVQNNENVTLLGNCGITQSINVPVAPQITLAESSKENAKCFGENTGEFSVSVSNGTADFTYFINGSPTVKTADSPVRNPRFDHLIAGNYAAQVIDANGCSSDVVSIPILEPLVLMVSTSVANPPFDVLCKGKSTGAIDVDVTGGNGGYVYSWSATGSYSPYVIPPVQDISSVNAGIYSLIVTDAKGCQPGATPHQVTISEPLVDFTANASKVLQGGGFDMTCALNDGEISLALTNENLPLQSVTWLRNAVNFVPSNPLNVTDLGPGNYSVTVVDNHGCDAAASITLNPHPGITVITQATSSFNGFNTKCPASDEGAGQVLSVTNGFGTLSYAWFDGSIGPSVSDLIPGSYNVTVTDGNGCSDSKALVINAPPAIQPQLQVTSNYNGAHISCPSAGDGRMEAFPLNGFGSYRYSWAHDISLATKFADGLSQGLYKITVTDDYGCSIEEPLMINDPATMDLTLTKKTYNGSDMSCHNVPDGEIQLTVTNGASPYVYTWSNNETTQNIAALAPGDYDVIVTDANLCTQTKSATIINPASLNVIVEHTNNFNNFDISCYGLADGRTKAVPGGGTGPYTYTWSNGAATNVNNGLIAGNYAVDVLDANGCATNGTITLIEPTLFKLSGTIDNPVSCFGLMDGQVSLSSQGGVTPYEYSRDQIAWQLQPLFAGLDMGMKDFYGRDANGCLLSIQKNIPQPDVIGITFQNIIDARCNDPVGSAEAVATGGNAGYNYSWFDDVTNQPFNSGAVLQNAIAGIYRVEVKDAKSCVASELVAVSSIGGAVFAVDNITPVSCFGFTDGASSISAPTGIAPFSYLWTDGQTTPTAIGLSAGRTFITVTDGLGCKALKQVIVPTPDPLTSQYTKTLPLCVGDCNGEIISIPAGGTSPYSYNWTTLGKTTDRVNAICAGTYDLLITDANSCLLTEKVELKNPDDLKIVPQITKPICLGRCDGSIAVTGVGGSGPYSFEWESGPSLSVISTICPGDYKVTMKDANDCLATDQFTLPNGDPLPLDLGTKATLCVGQSKVVDAGIIWVQSAWTSDIGFTSTASSVTIREPGTYFFKGVNAIGCVGLDTFRLETSRDLLKAEFLVPAEAFVGDTLVAIDISWPLPERVEWNYPTSFKQLAATSPDILNVQPAEAGTFSVSMRSFLAECRDLREKTILVSAKDNTNTGGRLGYSDSDLIKEFALYPNPNEGRFQVRVALSEEKEIQLKVVQFPIGIMKSEFRSNTAKNFNVNFDLPDLSQGLYIVLLRVGKEERFLRFFKE